MAIPLNTLLDALERIAPQNEAEDWDNVGLLIEPIPRGEAQSIQRILCTIDFGEDILAEAQQKQADLVLSYHPPIFSGIKRLTRKSTTERLIIDTLRASIFVYSPHTALDAAPGGVNDWLAQAIGEGQRLPIQPSKHPERPQFGLGRRIQLSEPSPLPVFIDRIKTHLGLPHIRVAASPAHAQGALIHSAAVCAGAGGALFAKMSGTDLYLTGEMRHHDIREKIAAGASVILCDHTNTERGFLPVLAKQLIQLTEGQAEIIVSELDRDPLTIT